MDNFSLIFHSSLCKHENYTFFKIYGDTMKNITCPYSFIKYILENTDHSMHSLSKLLEIPANRLKNMSTLTMADCMRIGELKGVLLS
jgi:hypothetical protein